MSEHLTPNGRERGFVRAVLTSVAIPDGDAQADAHLRIFHPARDPGDDSQRLTGVFPVDREEGQRLPVVLLLNGINVGPECYRWLAEELASTGIVAVTFSYVAPLMPGHVGLTPGVDVTAVTPDTWGNGPSCPTILPILEHLAELDASHSLLAGVLDLDRVGLWGHSAGGTMVLQNVDAHPSIRAGATFGAHGLVSTLLGWPEGTLLPVTAKAPLLLCGGTQDEVIARSADRYVGAGHQTDPLTRTFEEALPALDGDQLLAWFEGANHFLPVAPTDDTVARGFLELEPAADPDQQRVALGRLVTSFFAAHLLGDGDALASTLDAFDAGPVHRR